MQLAEKFTRQSALYNGRLSAIIIAPGSKTDPRYVHYDFPPCDPDALKLSDNTMCTARACVCLCVRNETFVAAVKHGGI